MSGLIPLRELLVLKKSSFIGFGFFGFPHLGLEERLLFARNIWTGTQSTFVSFAFGTELGVRRPQRVFVRLAVLEVRQRHLLYHLYHLLRLLASLRLHRCLVLLSGLLSDQPSHTLRLEIGPIR